MRSLAMLSALLLAGCIDSVIRVENSGQPYEESRNRGGYHASYCFTCMPGFDGKMNCGMKMSALCPCQYKAIVSVQPQIIYRESGAVEAREAVTEVKKLTNCG